MKLRQAGAFGSLQFHGVSDSNLAMRIANLENGIKCARAEVDSFGGKDLLLAKRLEARAFALSELTKVEGEYRTVVEELERRKEQQKKRKRQRKERSSIDSAA